MENLIFSYISDEKNRQEATINLIASENYASADVRKAAGSILTNKYAEGYPGRRYYGGCEIVDKIESLAIERGKKLFQAAHVNVQPHAGSQANFAVYLSYLKPGDTVLGMSLGAGGHLTHGHKVNFSGMIFNFVPYHVSPENEQLDYDEIELLANQHHPKMIVVGASAYSRIIDFARLRDIANRCGAFLFADMAHIAGLVAAGLHPSPIPFADFVSSTTHKTLRGPRGGLICCTAEHAQKIDKAVMPGSQGGPLMHIIAAKAIAFEEALSPAFKSYQEQVLKNAKAMAQAFQDLGCRIVSGGTDNHLFLIDLRSISSAEKSITGAEVETTLGTCDIILNRNNIPFDTEGPMTTSGIRIGTPAVTTRGFKEVQVIEVAHLIFEVIKNRHNEQFLRKVREKVAALCRQFPIYMD